MSEKFEYHGHVIDISPRKIGPKRWTWHYTIDGHHFHENFGEFAPDEATAISEAKYHAQGVIGRMP